MVGYNDPYNQAVTAESNAMVRRHAKKIDQLNGSGKNTGGVACPAYFDPVTDPATGKQYSNKCHMNAAKRPKGFFGLGASGGAACCARCKNCKCGKGMSGGASDTPIKAKEWFKAQDQDFEDQIHQTLTPSSVREARMDKDLGAGKGGRKCGAGWADKLGKATKVGNILAQNLLGDEGKSGKVKKLMGVAENVRSGLQGEGAMKRGMRGCGNELSSNPNVTPPEVARIRAKLDLGAGKFQGGAADYDDDDDEDYEDGDDCGKMEGGAAEYDDEPESLREMKSICNDYEQKKLTGGAMTQRIRAMLPHGKKKMSVALSKALQKLKKRGRASYNRRIQAGLIVPGRDLTGAEMPHSKGSGRYVGGAKDYPDIEQIHDSIFGGSRMTGGYGPVAPTTEALAGYDNKNQPRGLKPPPSVNQQPGMTGGSVPLHKGEPLAKKDRPVLSPPVQKGRGVSGGVADPPHSLIPVAQLPSKIGGGRFSKKGNYIGPSTGAIIPNLQSSAAPSGSGRASRGAAVAKLMREKGMTLGEASRALKGGAYTANDFFQPRNIHQFFGAYA
jgi:hypothetical protein